MLTCPTCAHEFPRPTHVRLVKEQAAGYVEGDVIAVVEWAHEIAFGPMVSPGPLWPWRRGGLIPLCRFGSDDCEWVPDEGPAQHPIG